jgi:hypothetical protein
VKVKIKAIRNGCVASEHHPAEPGGHVRDQAVQYKWHEDPVPTDLPVGHAAPDGHED